MKLRVLLYCVLGGVVIMLPALSVGHLFWFWLSGAVLTAAFVPVALFGPRTVPGQFGVIFPILFVVSALTTWSEGLIFMRSAMGDRPILGLIGQSVMYLILAAVLAVLARVLKLTRESTVGVSHYPVVKVAGLVLICALAYTIYYLIFGAITYQYFTKGYYPEATSVVERLGLWFWGIEIGRGLLMTLAILPAIYTLRMSRLHTAICAGLLVWVAGGLAPLLVPNEFMGSTQRFIHVIEIFTQNFTLGLTAGLLLRRKAAQVGLSHSAIAA